MKPTARLKLTLLGGFQAQLGGGLALVLPTRKTQALVAYLALPPDRAHPREKLATLLWGDMPDAQARGNLRQTLSRIRKALPNTARTGILLDGPTVALQSSTVDVDVARFEHMVADGSFGALEQIPDVYRGDLLAGLALAERPFDEWLTSERERLHELAIQSLHRLLVEQQQAGAIEPAVQTGLRLLALDGMQEPVHRIIMRLYARLGRREAAIRQYRVCVDMLRRELHAEPEAETHQLFQEILRSRPIHGERVAGTTPASAPPVSAPVASAVAGTTATLATTSPLTNLPASTSELIGRDVELEEVTGLLDHHRLVTLIGAGGIGKTRLGLDVASQMLPRFAYGVWVGELAPLSDPRLVPVTVAVALGLPLPRDAEAPEQVAAALGGKHLLLVLDSCEHVIDAAARMAEALLRANPHVRILATSREPLRAPGEWVYRVQPLQVPEAEGREDPLVTAAVRLFVARARAVDLRFSLDARSAAIAGAVCRRLDGIPLAIELAAARTATLGMDALAARLDDRFRFLTGGHRTALPRHRTLRATLDWGYELLSPVERTVLHCLSVFAGGFTLEAASAVAAGADLDPSDVPDNVTNLAAKSLVDVEVAGSVTRYRLLETTRAYALQKLRDAGELGSAARHHAEYHRDLLELGGREAETRSAVEWLAVYGRLIHDVRAALDWAFSSAGDAELGMALTLAAEPLWIRLRLVAECCARVERAIACIGGDEVRPDARRDMRLFLAMGTAQWDMLLVGRTREAVDELTHTRGVGSLDMTAALARALELAERVDDTECRLRALFGLYHYEYMMGDYHGALARAEALVQVGGRTGDPNDALIARRLTGSVLHVLGDQAGARRAIEPLVGVDLTTGRRSHIARYRFDQRVVTHSIFARILWLQGFLDQARRLAGDIVTYARAGDHVNSLVYALVQAGYPVALETGDYPAAERLVVLLRELSVTQRLEGCSVWARCVEAVLLIKRGERAVGSRGLQAALATVPEAVLHLHRTPLMGDLAEGFGSAGQVADGLAVIDEALARAERREERWILPELLRKKGELLLLAGAPTSEAQEHFERGLDLARGQGATAWELRTATSLARLWHRQGRGGPARELLAQVYRRFTEGFDTIDLRAAEALLADLG